jgi:hypothetical protein
MGRRNSTPAVYSGVSLVADRSARLECADTTTCRRPFRVSMRYDPPMHPHLREVFDRLEESRALLRGAVDAFPAPAPPRRPAPDCWSAAEILEHLSLVEHRFTAMLATRIDEALQAGLAPESSERDPLPLAIEQRMADRTNKRTAPETAIPSGTLDDRAALAAAERARAALRETVQRGDGLALGTVHHRHAFFGELTIYQWVELIAHHERRHVEQIRELRAQLAAGTA